MPQWQERGDGEDGEAGQARLLALVGAMKGLTKGETVWSVVNPQDPFLVRGQGSHQRA